MKTFTKTLIEIEENFILVKIYEEPRNNVRASMNKNGAILRMPLGLKNAKKQEFLHWFRNWLTQQLNDDKTKQLLIGKKYATGDSLMIFGRMYQLVIEYQIRKTHFARLKNGVIYLKMNKNDISIQKSIGQLISRIVAKDCMPVFEKKVDFWNDKYFQERINTIKFKNNQSNWGSCSSKQNLNFSTRLLFATSEAIDYVIVHELAHLKELNHSAKFWKIVENVMPDYKKQEVWLKENGYLCYF